MSRHIWFGTIVLVAGSVAAAQSSPVDEVKSAAKKLGEKSGYSWKSTVESAGGGGGRARTGPTEGKTDKEGFILLSMTRGENTIEAVLKGGKGAIKGPDGWMSLAEATEAGAGGQRNPAAFIARTLTTYKAPAVQAADLAAKAKDLKKADDAYTGELTEEAIKELLTFGRPGGNAPAPSNAKGSVKFWIKDGLVTKYQFNVQATVTFNNNDINIDRTTTVEIKDIDSTKVEVPEEAKKKMASVAV
jgi:hypothetical protein